MTYCTQQDLVERFGEQELVRLTDRNRNGVIDAQVVDLAIADAAGEVDGYLSVRYALPLPQVPRMLVQIACDIARWYLYDDRATDQVRDRYKDARLRLERISEGRLDPGLPEPTGSETGGSAEAQGFGGRHVFPGGGF